MNLKNRTILNLFLGLCPILVNLQKNDEEELETLEGRRGIIIRQLMTMKCWLRLCSSSLLFMCAKPFSKKFNWPFQGDTSFVDHLCYLCLVFVMLSRLFIAAWWSPNGKGLTSWPLSVMFIVFLLLSHVVSWVRCGIWLYRFLIVAIFLTLFWLRSVEKCHLWRIQWLKPGPIAEQAIL